MKREATRLFAKLTQTELRELNKLLLRHYLRAHRAGQPGLRGEMFDVLCQDVLPHVIV